MMTRNEMKALLQEGRSIYFGGRLIESEAHLPTVAEMALAAKDPEAEVNALAELQQQMAELTAQMAALQPPVVTPVQPPVKK